VGGICVTAKFLLAIITLNKQFKFIIHINCSQEMYEQADSGTICNCWCVCLSSTGRDRGVREKCRDEGAASLDYLQLSLPTDCVHLIGDAASLRRCRNSLTQVYVTVGVYVCLPLAGTEDMHSNCWCVRLSVCS
jgi:hypothetical protein